MTSQPSSHFINAMTFLLANFSPTPLHPVNTRTPSSYCSCQVSCVLLWGMEVVLSFQGAYLRQRVRKVVHVIFVKQLHITFDITLAYLYVCIHTYKYIRNSVFLVVVHITYLLSCPHFVKEGLELTSRFFGWMFHTQASRRQINKILIFN
jgi:hypothetical protein